MIRKLLLALLAVCLTSPALAQTSNVRIVGRDSGGNDRPVLVTLDGRLQTDASAGPSASANSAVVPAATTAVASALVGKASAGNLYSVNIVTGASAGYLLIFNATAAPADGAVTPVKCLPVAANTGIETNARDMPEYFATGIVAVFSTTGCFTKTASATAFISIDAK